MSITAKTIDDISKGIEILEMKSKNLWDFIAGTDIMLHNLYEKNIITDFSIMVSLSLFDTNQLTIMYLLNNEEQTPFEGVFTYIGHKK